MSRNYSSPFRDCPRDPALSLGRSEQRRHPDLVLVQTCFFGFVFTYVFLFICFFKNEIRTQWRVGIGGQSLGLGEGCPPHSHSPSANIF